MPNRKTRERHLQKLAARRAAERRRARRRRITAIVVSFVVVLAAGAFLFKAFAGSDSTPAAKPSSKPSASTSPTPAPAGQFGTPKKTGTVKPAAPPPKKVACGGSVPKEAGQPKPQFSPAPDPKKYLKPNTTYTATVDTSCGSFDIALDAKEAPDAVASFV